jgi:two-component system sensor kinase FixL
MDEAARILIFNKACEQLFGYSAGEVIGENVGMLMPHDHAERHDLYVQRYRSTGERRIIGIGREVEGRRKDGSLVPLDLSVGEAQTPNGRQFIGVIRDLSARHDADRRFADLQGQMIRMARVSALDEMGSALAHELNQPLTAIMLYLQALQREVERLAQLADERSPRSTELLSKSMREAQRAGSIIQRVRQLVEKRAPERRRVDLNMVLDEALELAMMGHKRVVQLVRISAEDLPPVTVDPVQIQQVILNLVRNAIEAARDVEMPKVVVSTWRDDNAAYFAVEDNGPGIPADQMKSLFQPFKSESGKGMGIGLSISRTIAQNHMGDLTVDRGVRAPGARFTVRLPVLIGDGATRDSAQAVPLAAVADRS